MRIKTNDTVLYAGIYKASVAAIDTNGYYIIQFIGEEPYIAWSGDKNILTIDGKIVHLDNNRKYLYTTASELTKCCIKNRSFKYMAKKFIKNTKLFV
jgi:hypothetical protein